MQMLILAVLLVSAYAHIEIADSSGQFEDMPALFGPTCPPEGLTGYLIPMRFFVQHGLTKDESGCSPIDIPQDAIKNWTAGPSASQHSIPWIALVERGHCSFDRKVLSMQASGAIGVVVGDNIVGGSLVRMTGSGLETQVRIPSTFISHWDANKLQSLAVDEYGKLNKLVIRLLSDEISLTPIIILLFVMIFIILAGIWKARNDENAARFPNFPQFFRDDPAPISIVRALPTKTFSSKQLAENDPDICAICLEDFYEGVELRKLPCKHEFHVECIDPWLLTRKKLCPICKADVCPNITVRIASLASGLLNRGRDYRSQEREPLLPSQEENNTFNGLLLGTPSSGVAGRSATPISAPSSPSSVSSDRTTVISLRRSAAHEANANNSNLNVVVADEGDYEEARQLAFDLRNSSRTTLV